MENDKSYTYVLIHKQKLEKWLVGMALDHWCDFYNLPINYAFNVDMIITTKT